MFIATWVHRPRATQSWVGLPFLIQVYGMCKMRINHAYGVSFDGERELEFTGLDLGADAIHLALRYRVGWFAR